MGLRAARCKMIMFDLIDDSFLFLNWCLREMSSCYGPFLFLFPSLCSVGSMVY